LQWQSAKQTVEPEAALLSLRVILQKERQVMSSSKAAEATHLGLPAAFA